MNKRYFGRYWRTIGIGFPGFGHGNRLYDRAGAYLWKRPQMAQGRDSGASLVPHVFPCFSRLDYQFSQTNAGGKDIHLGSAFCSSFHGFSVFSSDFRSHSVSGICSKHIKKRKYAR